MDRRALVILADGNPDRRHEVGNALSSLQDAVELVEVASREELETSLSGDGPPPVVVAAVAEHEPGHFEFLEAVAELRPMAPTVMIADAADEALVVEALRGGALDLVVVTEPGLARLVPAVEAALEEVRDDRAGAPVIGGDPNLAAEIVDALDTMVVVLDLRGRIVHFNRACEKATGFSAIDVTGRRIWDILIPEAEREEVKAVFGDLRDGGYTSHHRNHWLTKDGHRRLVEWSNTAVRGAGAETRYIVGTGIDVTEQQRAEAELDSRRKFFEALVETMTDGLAVDDVNGRLSYVNNRFCELIGYPRDDIVGRPVEDFLDPASVSILKEENERRAAGEKAPYELTFRRKNGGTIELLVSPQVLRNQEGKTTASFAVLTDLTPIRRIEEERALLATAIEQSGESVIITGVDGEIHYVNPAFEEVTGYSRDEVIGSNPSILKSGKQDDEFYRELWTTITAGEVWTGVFINRAKDGSLFEEDATISPVRDESGEIVSFVAVKRDVTEERMLAKQLEGAQKLEAVGLLAGGIAHDFNNILMAIAGSTEVLRLRAPEALVDSKELATIHKTVERGAELTRRLLSVAQQQSLDLAHLNLNEIVERELDILRRVVPASIEIALAAGKGPLTVRGDRGQLAHMVMNLVVNAREAMPNGGRITVSTTKVTADALLLAAHPSAREGRYIRLTVEDSGVGMDADIRDRVFEPFFSTKEDPDKTGLGLATVYGVVHQHNGMIDLDSTPNAGTRFDIYLPAATAPADAIESGPEVAAVGGQETILVVEDEAAVRHAQVEMLVALGYTVREAENGRIALQVLERDGDAIDLVLSDVTMPEMGGRELFDKARELEPNTPFVFSSGYTGDELMKGMRNGDNAHFIAKPYSLAQLAGIIRKALSASSDTEA